MFQTPPYTRPLYRLSSNIALLIGILWLTSISVYAQNASRPAPTHPDRQGNKQDTTLPKETSSPDIPQPKPQLKPNGAPTNPKYSTLPDIITSNDLEDEYAYSSEFTYGINFNTHAGLIGGFALKYATRLNKDRYQGFGFEVAHIKNQKEVHLVNQSTSNSFIPYKLNYLFSLRPQYTQEFVLFRKAPEDGVEINAIIGGGPSIGLIKPYYVLYDAQNNDPNRAVSIPYDPKVVTNLNNVFGVGSFFDGFNAMSAVLGAHAKAGLSFEFGSANSNVVGLEAGFLYEVYNRNVNLVYNTTNTNRFASAYIILYYGSKE